MTSLVSVDLPPVGGLPGLTQGAYGTRGNLELVVPAVDTGFWVLWFNADEHDERSGAAVGCWSGGLHVETDDRLTAVTISQIEAGPRFLEVTLLGGDTARRMFWCPERGFVAGGVLEPAAAAVAPIRELAGAMTTMITTTDGRTLWLRGEGYPEPAWAATPAPPAAWEEFRRMPDGWTVRVQDGRVRFEGERGIVETGIEADAAAAARTTLDGGRTDLLVRRGDRLAHAWTGRTDDAWPQPRTITSTVWTEPEDRVHRRG
ncbi:MAG: hypothetical protein QM638_14275 [Nocardioides sp.]|uniref:hypothetical protein n=1 Tax=Nocardioides sp. TaxID=35761 RepID=UPI0039E56701